MLHPEIPEQGPRIGTPAEHDAAGFFVGGPMPARPMGILKLMQDAYIPPDVPAPDTTREAKRDRRAKMRERRREELLALLADIRAKAS
jgi:hypothetical protein